jgi:hypothetical protein
MAFQTGSQVRPELGRADVSGFARGGEYIGQALANIGRDIGEGIEKYQKNKQITATSLAQLEAIGSARPDAYAALKTAGGDVSQSISNIEKGDYKQKDVSLRRRSENLRQRVKLWALNGLRQNVK